MFIFNYKKRAFFRENESFIKKYVHTCNIWYVYFTYNAQKNKICQY